MSKDKLIPELRFPEFENEGEWGSENLGVICDVRDGTHDSPKYVSEGYPLITSKNLLIDGTMDFTNVNYLTEYDYIQINKRSKVDSGDILFGMIGTIGNTVIVKKDGFAIKNVALIKSKGQINQDFLLHQLKSNFIGKQFERVNAGGILKFIALGIIRDLNTLVPIPQEQQKIASCLSSLDEVIAAHSQKLDLLKDHKKGLMQNLFPQDGEKVPKYRFKEFEKDGEWEETSVEENCLVKGRIGYRGYTTDDIVEQGKGALVLGGKHIQNQLLRLTDPTFVSWEKYYESPEIMVEVGDIIFSQRGTLGDCAIIDKEIGPATINPSMVLLKNITCDARFLYYILIGDGIQNEVRKNRAMGAIPMISQKQIKEFPFLIPKSKEQQKIASCLSSLDALITAQAEKIEQIKLHKKGLMQGLFPKIND